jgi:hypothetical protein
VCGEDFARVRRNHAFCSTACCKLHTSRTPIARRKARSKSYRERYGITVEQYEAMLAAQGGVCAICGKLNGNSRLYVDHCHRDGGVRGLLCARCNSWLGRYEQPGFLERADAYLARFAAAQ